MINSLCIAISVVLAFAISAILGKFLIPILHKLKYGQTILEIGPNWHKSKQGTPTMGGIMFIVGITISTFVTMILYIFLSTAENYYDARQSVVCIFISLLMALCFGAIGFLDDYIKVVKKRNLGLKAGQKLVLQFTVAILYLVALRFVCGMGSETIIPFYGVLDLGIFYYILAAIAIVGMTNAVNLTDGIDGLDGSITFFAAIFLMLIASIIDIQGSAILSGALAGGCLGFLLWNFHPAKVFMGDTGSLFLGGMLCAVTFSMQVPVLLVVIGLVYWFEMLSVVLQVAYFKITHGKRLFKMSPIHHHFEMCGWSETKIVVVFSAVTAVLGVISLVAMIFYYH